MHYCTFLFLNIFILRFYVNFLFCYKIYLTQPTISKYFLSQLRQISKTDQVMHMISGTLTCLNSLFLYQITYLKQDFELTMLKSSPPPPPNGSWEAFVPPKPESFDVLLEPKASPNGSLPNGSAAPNESFLKGSAITNYIYFYQQVESSLYQVINSFVQCSVRPVNMWLFVHYKMTNLSQPVTFTNPNYTLSTARFQWKYWIPIWCTN